MRVKGELFQINRSLKLISNKIGLFQNVGKASLFNSDPKIIGYTSFNCNTVRLGAENYAGKSGGCGFEWENSFLASIGEGVERYCTVFYDLKKLKRGTFKGFKKGEATMPHKFALFHPNQYKKKGFPFAPFEEDTGLYWERVYDLIGNKYIYCPAIFVYMPFTSDERYISEQISTGFAAHSDYYKALLSGLYEVIERDSFMIAWTNLLDLPKIKIEGSLKKFVDTILPNHFELHLFDMTTDIKVPSVFGILKGKHDFGEFIAFSAATRFTYSEAVKKTILELCQSVPYFRYLLPENKNKNFNDYGDLKSFEDHSVFYTKKKDHRNIFDKWLNKTPDLRIDFSEKNSLTAKGTIASIKKEFVKKNYQILVKDVTTFDVNKAGFKVVRVICPELIHINGSYNSYYFGGKRLYDVPEKMGYNKKTYDELNFMPHPFP